MKRALSVTLSALLVAVMLFIPSNTLFAENEACFRVSSHEILVGDEVDVTVSINNSPGIASAKLLVYYDNDLTLDRVTYNGELGGMCQEPNSLSSPVVLNWLSLEEISGDIVFATLHFTTGEDTPLGENVINITFEADDVFDIDENNVDFAVQPGYVEVSDCLHENTTDYPAVESTCVTHGHAAYTLCNDCGNVIGGSNKLLPLDSDNHEGPYEITGGFPATYFETGYTGDTYCSACGVMVQEGEIIPVLIPIPGDVNYDERITSNDVVELISIILGRLPPAEAADVTQDDKVDVVDLVRLKKILIDLESD